MLNENVLYRGNVHIHLQGPRALLPVESIHEDQVTYFIGSKKSKLLIRDFREEPIRAAQHNPAGVEGADFTVAFNNGGRHDLNLGAEYVYSSQPIFLGINSNGFLDVQGGPIPANIEQLFPVWNDISTWNLNALSPIARFYQLAVGNFESNNPITSVAGWAQDDWTMGRLTLNLGVRYDIIKGTYGEERGFDPWLAPNRPLDTNNIQPRLGFAYGINDRTVARGGWGLFYGGGTGAAHAYYTETQIINVQVNNDGRPDFASNPFNGPIPTYEQVVRSGALRSLFLTLPSDHAVIPFAHQASVGLQRQFGAILVQAAYSGSRGVHLGDGAGFQINQLPASALELGNALQQLVPNPFLGIVTNPGPLRAAQVARGQLLRPYPHFGNLTVFNPAAGGSSYHGFSIKAERRFAAGLGFLASYTTSKNISDAPATVGPSAQHQNSYNRRADRSLAEEDIAQRFTSSVTWELPFGRGRKAGAGWGKGLDALAGLGAKAVPRGLERRHEGWA